jgi:hypothetical protein
MRYEGKINPTFRCHKSKFSHFSSVRPDGNSIISRNIAPTRPRTQHDCHHDTKVKPEAATAVIELLMMGGKTPETCWTVNKRQDSKMENCCIRLVIYLNRTTVSLYIFTHSSRSIVDHSRPYGALMYAVIDLLQKRVIQIALNSLVGIGVRAMFVCSMLPPLKSFQTIKPLP